MESDLQKMFERIGQLESNLQDLQLKMESDLQNMSERIGQLESNLQGYNHACMCEVYSVSLTIFFSAKLISLIYYSYCSCLALQVYHSSR